MDSFRDFASDLEPAFGSHAVEGVEVLDDASERRMQVKAYNYWTSLLDGRDFPSIEDLEPANIAEFAKHSVLLDFTSGAAGASVAYIGAVLRRECDLDADTDQLAEVPFGSLLSRLGDYYTQIVEGRAPVGIETEFANQRGEGRCYRGILMPFSSDGDTVDFVYGVFNWSEAEVTDEPQAAALPETTDEVLELEQEPDEAVLELEQEEVDDTLELSEPVDAPQVDEPVYDPYATIVPFASVPRAEPEPEPEPEFEPESEPEHLSWQDGPLADQEEALEDGQVWTDQEPEPVEAIQFEEPVSAEPEPPSHHVEMEAENEPFAFEDEEEPPAALTEWLTAARATAEDAKAADGRSRQALYQALAQAYDFACAAAQAPGDYQRLLDDCGIVVQARAPMTAVAKLVFGADYDKARLTEYAAALSYAARQNVENGGFLAFIEDAEGGLKGLVEAERRFRRPDGATDGWREKAVSRLRLAEPRSLDSLAGNGEFALVLVRRDALGDVTPVAAVSDPALLDKALKKATA